MKIIKAELNNASELLKAQKQAFSKVNDSNSAPLKETLQDMKKRIKSKDWIIYLCLSNNNIIACVELLLNPKTNSAYCYILFSLEKGISILFANKIANLLKKQEIKKVYARTCTGSSMYKIFEKFYARLMTKLELKEFWKIYNGKFEKKENRIYLIKEL